MEVVPKDSPVFMVLLVTVLLEDTETVMLQLLEELIWKWYPRTVQCLWYFWLQFCW